MNKEQVIEAFNWAMQDIELDPENYVINHNAQAAIFSRLMQPFNK